jgi:hypothetical protein
MNRFVPITPTPGSPTDDESRILSRLGTLADETPPTSAGAGKPPNGQMPRGTILAEFVAKLLAVVARKLSPAFVERSLAMARRVGQYAVLAGSGLTLLYAIFAAIKYNSFAVFLTGLGMLAALAVAQFAATRFLAAAGQTIANTPSRISSIAFLECTGLLVLLLAATVFAVGLVTSIQVGRVAVLLPAVLVAVMLAYFGAVALHPMLVNVTTDRGSAGEEAIGLLSFFFKAGLALIPLSFCLLAIGGCLAVLASFFSSGQSLAAAIGAIVQALPFPVTLPYGLAGSAVILLACLLPFMAWFVFVLQYLFLDVLRAILSVPAKLDALRAAP